MYSEAANNIELDQRSRDLRRLVVDALAGGGRGHVGSAMSLIEIFRVLYDDVLRFDPKQPRWAMRDRCILSKGHGCLALYAMLADKGFISHEDLTSFCKQDSILGGHPEDVVPGVEASTGALGHGFAIGMGMAVALRMAKIPRHVFVVMGDGEINEGSVWETALSAGKHRLESLTAIIDYNKLQSYGRTSEVLDLEPLRAKWEAFGFGVQEVNGHDVMQLRDALRNLPYENNKPNVLICHTVKGKGFHFAEHHPGWHHKSKLKPDELERLYACLEDSTCA